MENQKNTGFFGFLVRSLVKNQKNPVFFLDFCWKTKKHHVFFGFLLENQNNPRKTKKSKSFGPLRRVLDFWVFGFVVPSAETKEPKNQNLSAGPETFGFFGFPRFFWFSNRNPKNHMFFFGF